MEISTRLSPSQARFALLLKRAPYLSNLWDMSRAEYIPERVDRFLSTASSGEIIMARFYLGVWCNQDKFDFDFTDAAAKLDETQMAIIIEWLKEPFWP